MQNAARSTLGILVCAGLTGSIHAQAFRALVLSDGEVGPGRTLAITDAGDAVVRVGDELGIWQPSAAFNRPAGLSMIGTIDRGAVNRVSRHIDRDDRFYGSFKGRASAWSRDMGHADLDTRDGIGSWIDDASWPDFLVGGEQDRNGPATPVYWTHGARVELDLPAGTRTGVATGVNAGGEVVGVVSADEHAVIRWAAVASSFDRSTQAAIWIGNEAVLLDELVVGAGLSIVRADDINNRGQIAATAVDASGLFYAVVLEPAGADLNGDGVTSPADINAWLALAGNNDRRGDLTRDGVVDGNDFRVMIDRVTSRFDHGQETIAFNVRAAELSLIMNTNGMYDAQGMPEPGLQPGNSNRQNWIDCGPPCWNDYHPDFNPNCYGCDGDDANNPHSPDGAPGWPGNTPGHPYGPNGGPGGDGSDGDPAGDGGPGGDGAPGDPPDLPGNGGPGGNGGDNTDDGNGGKGGDGGNGGTGVEDPPGAQPGGNGGGGGKGGGGGSNGGNGGDGGDGGPGGAGGADGGATGAGGNGGGGGDAGDGGDAPNGEGGDGGEGGAGGAGGGSDHNPGGAGGPGGGGGDGGDGSNGDGSGNDGGAGGPGGTGDPDGQPGSDGNDGSP